MTTPRINITDLLSSRIRTRIIHSLAKHEELNISAICKDAKINNVAAKKHLTQLVAWNIAEEKRFGRIRIYRLKQEIAEVNALIRIFQLWDSHS